MMQFKRNQVEDAISQALDDSSAAPSGEMRTRIKRLLDTDRSLTRKARENGSDVTNYAFYSEDAPGKGVEVAFSLVEAFALQTSLRVLQHGWPQSFAVNALRRLRSDLERHYNRIMKQDPSVLFDERSIVKNARLGALPVDNTDPVFLTIVSGKAKFGNEIDDQTTAEICRGMEGVAKLITRHEAHSWTLIELATHAHRLSQALSRTEPRNRGRS